MKTQEERHGNMLDKKGGIKEVGCVKSHFL